MIVDVTVPVLAESVPDATLLDWSKQIGEAVAEGEVLIEGLFRTKDVQILAFRHENAGDEKVVDPLRIFERFTKTPARRKIQGKGDRAELKGNVHKGHALLLLVGNQPRAVYGKRTGANPSTRADDCHYPA